MDREGWGCLAIIVLVFAAVWFGIWGRGTELRYVMQYSSTFEMVEIEKKPHDCDFTTAPLGRKHCRYKKHAYVEKYRQDTETGRPVISRDNGKTWDFNDGGPRAGTAVYVSWEKEED